ncbi:hypothetical protein VTI74DRAFT_6995 [Chaetomium olivicolor]
MIYRHSAFRLHRLRRHRRPSTEPLQEPPQDALANSLLRCRRLNLILQPQIIDLTTTNSPSVANERHPLRHPRTAALFSPLLLQHPRPELVFSFRTPANVIRAARAVLGPVEACPPEFVLESSACSSRSGTARTIASITSSTFGGGGGGRC